MIDRLKKSIFKALKLNAKGYILITAIFVAGMVLSTIVNISSGSEEEIKLYIKDFIENVKNYSTDSATTFKIAISGYVQFVAFVFLMSVTVVGSIGVLAYIFIKGFSYGAVFATLIDMSCADALLLFLCSILPHIIISAPCCICYLLYCTKKSYSALKGIKNIKSGILFPAAYGVLCLAFLSVSALIQAYVEPVFIRFINFN